MLAFSLYIYIACCSWFVLAPRQPVSALPTGDSHRRQQVRRADSRASRTLSRPAPFRGATPRGGERDAPTRARDPPYRRVQRAHGDAGASEADGADSAVPAIPRSNPACFQPPHQLDLPGAAAKVRAVRDAPLRSAGGGGAYVLCR